MKARKGRPGFSLLTVQSGFALLASLLAVCAAAFGSDSAASTLEASLLAKYGKQVVTLRGFYQDKTLHFDAKGNVQGKPHPGSWTLSRINIEKIEVSANKIDLSGHRLAAVNISKQIKFSLTHQATGSRRGGTKPLGSRRRSNASRRWGVSQRGRWCRRPRP
jgi:hypothetical protein